MSYVNSSRVVSVLAFVALLAFLPMLSSAQILGGGNGGEIGQALGSIVKFIQGVLIPFLFAIGFFMFVWGIIKFFVIGANNDDAKASGKSLIIYAIAGYVIIFAFWGVVNIISNGIGLENENLEGTVNLPTPSGR